MLWPRDPEARHLYMRTTTVKAKVEAADHLRADETRALAKEAFEAPRLDDLQNSEREQFKHGFIAGMILVEAVVLHDTGDSCRLTDIKKSLERRLGLGQHFDLRPLSGSRR